MLQIWLSLGMRFKPNILLALLRPFPRLHGFLIRQKGGRLHEKNRKGPHRSILDPIGLVFCPSEVQANHRAPLEQLHQSRER